MRIIHKDLKKGEIKLIVDNLDDIWYLSNIIEKGDVIKGSTTRKIMHGEKGEKVRIERKRIFLSIEIEKLDYSEVRVLRALGQVTEGSEDVGKGSHHTFEIEKGEKFTIIKQTWLNYQLDWLKESANDKYLKILVCVLDRENASFAISKKQGYEILSELKGDVQKKDERSSSKGDFYLKIIEQIKKYNEKYNSEYMVIASPAFFKDDLMKKWKSCEFKNKIILSGCSNIGKNGVNEVLKRQEVAKILEKDKAVNEMLIVDKILTEISIDGKAVYGFKGVKKSANSGAIEILVVSDKFINLKREKNEFKELEYLMKGIEKIKGKVNIITSENEGGKKLDGLGGIAALLRYKLIY